MTKAELRQRTSDSAYRIRISPDGKTPLPADMARVAADLFAKHCLEHGLAYAEKDRLRINGGARALATSVARRLAWMLDPHKCHGQQASAYASKTIRALKSGRITFDDLAGRAREFGSLRKKHIRNNSEKKPCAKARVLKLERTSIVARSLVTGAQIDEIGHKMHNCLANKDYASEYKSQLRRREIDLIVVEGEGRSPESLLKVDISTGTVSEIKGVSNERPVGCRTAIAELLGKLDYRVGECDDALNVGVCDQQIQAFKAKRLKTFHIYDRLCEVGSEFLAIVWGDSTCLLRGDVVAWSFNVCVIQPDGESYLSQAECRVWVRKACRDFPRFRRACLTAFSDAPETLRLDWFGEAEAD